jgi:hypothetical protein
VEHNPSCKACSCSVNQEIPFLLWNPNVRYCAQKNLPHISVTSIYLRYILILSRVSSGSIVSDYGLDDRAIGVRSPAEAKDFSSNLCVQTGSGAHPASCTMGTGGSFPGGKSAVGA